MAKRYAKLEYRRRREHGEFLANSVDLPERSVGRNNYLICESDGLYEQRKSGFRVPG